MITIYMEKDKRKHRNLLLLADEQWSMIEKYLDRGTMYVLQQNGQTVAQCVVTDEGEGIVEIKNISVDEAHQKRGYGRCLIEFVEKQYRDTHRYIQVGTGDSPLTVPFYERCGFMRSHVVENFFTDNYDHPIVEDGVLLRDMIYFRKGL